jgi:tRNA A-37 threonylcarbamoyl transferase component Bud32
MIPAPDNFIDLREHLNECGVDVSVLRKAISTYLSSDENQVFDEFSDDVQDEHQAFEFREMLDNFLASIS